MKNTTHSIFGSGILLALLSAPASAASLSLGSGETISSTQGLVQVTSPMLVDEMVRITGDHPLLDVGANSVPGSYGGGNMLLGYDNFIFSSEGDSYGNLVSGYGNNVSALSSLVAGTQNYLQPNTLEVMPDSSIVMGYSNLVEDAMHSVALGMGNTIYPPTGATTPVYYGVAIGGGNTLQSSTGVVIGIDNEATGVASMTLGWGLTNPTHSTVALGTFNAEITGNATTHVEDGPGLIVGTGTGTAPFNAIVTLKNGQTRLANKAWVSAVTTDPDDALEDPPATADSGGNALVVDGHTVLNGKVIIAVPQGDISMGNYGN